MSARTNRIIPPLIVAFVLVTAAPTFAGQIIHVDANATGANDGSSWADAFNYLQDALADANSLRKQNVIASERSERGNLNTIIEIRVAQGIYKPDQGTGITPGDREATFQLLSCVTLKGGFAGFGVPEPNGRDIKLYETILSGDLDGNDLDVNNPSDLWDEPTRAENSYHVVTGSDTDETAILDGFTITGGYANGPEHENQNRAGGMYTASGSPTVTYCAFIRNFGGGMYNKESSPTLINCMFIENSAHHDAEGGGMGNWRSKPNIIGCTFRENMAGYEGGGISNSSSTPLLTRCTFSNNSANRGGGIFNGNSNLSLTNCTFADNLADCAGGAIYNGWHSNSILINCVFSGNLVSGGCYGPSGGAIFSYSSYLNIKHCTFFANSAPYGNALACDVQPIDPPSNIQLSMSILWDGGDEIWNDDESTIEITYSDVEGGWLGEGNIDADPCFVEPGYWDADSVWIDGDYHLFPGSPCIDAGDPNFIAEPNETDLDGKPRVLDGDNNGVLVVDMGAYEYRFTISAEARIIPKTINLASKGNWITSYIWLPEEYDVADIDPNSIFLEEQIKGELLLVNEEKQIAMARFSRSELQAILTVGQNELTVTGLLTDETAFEATDVIRVTGKPSQKAEK